MKSLEMQVRQGENSLGMLVYNRKVERDSGRSSAIFALPDLHL
jgi:hypothetical protein